ncbi:hypothetical protein [Sciscionella sediminilitoris]|uniref:hypothetical protein n=1 Tax=Sciscionella sediminilitoris TaxID=1445613 RepID=UPI0004DEF59C|nr:hypothetical protein [Sciscionella sp. SE31]
MGMIRKTTSMITFGAVDFRSDKERIARNTKKGAKELRKQNDLMIQQQKLAAKNARLERKLENESLAEQNRLLAEEE